MCFVTQKNIREKSNACPEEMNNYIISKTRWIILIHFKCKFGAMSFLIPIGFRLCMCSFPSSELDLSRSGFTGNSRPIFPEPIHLDIVLSKFLNAPCQYWKISSIPFCDSKRLKIRSDRVLERVLYIATIITGRPCNYMIWKTFGKIKRRRANVCW